MTKFSQSLVRYSTLLLLGMMLFACEQYIFLSLLMNFLVGILMSNATWTRPAALLLLTKQRLISGYLRRRVVWE
jgi:hypothetical protein